MKNLSFTMLTIFIVLCGSMDTALAWDLIKLKSASKELRTGITELTETADKLPGKIKDAIGENIKLTGGEITGVLDKIENSTVPAVNKAIVTDIEKTGDVIHALTQDLKNIELSGIQELNAALKDRLDQYFELADKLGGSLNQDIDEWIEKTKDSILAIENRDEKLIVHSIDILTFNSIRFASVFLFLIGLLVIGTILFQSSQKTGDYDFKNLNVKSLVSLALIVIFFASSFTLALKPEILAKNSANRLSYLAETGCDRYLNLLNHQSVISAHSLSELKEINLKKLEKAKKECFENRT